MKYKVIFEKKAEKSLKKIDHTHKKIILSWIKTNLENCENPRQYGKALTGDKKGYWRYRVGAYRLITRIDDDRLIIIMINVSHRKNIYKF